MLCYSKDSKTLNQIALGGCVTPSLEGFKDRLDMYEE